MVAVEVVAAGGVATGVWELLLLANEAAWSDNCLVDERVTLRGGMNKRTLGNLWYLFFVVGRRNDG